jgi:predicted XRE-type DNA-binding protein
MSSKRYTNVFDALEDDPVVADNLRIRSELMIQLREFIEQEHLTQEEAARHMGVTQPRISDLVRGKIERFTIDMLINMLTRVGLHVEITLKKAAYV